MSRSSILMAAASVAGASQSGPAGLLFCDSLVAADFYGPAAGPSERQILEARAAAQLAAAAPAPISPSSVRPRFNWRRALEGFRVRRPRLA